MKQFHFRISSNIVNVHCAHMFRMLCVKCLHDYRFSSTHFMLNKRWIILILPPFTIKTSPFLVIVNWICIPYSVINHSLPLNQEKYFWVMVICIFYFCWICNGPIRIFNKTAAPFQRNFKCVHYHRLIFLLFLTHCMRARQCIKHRAYSA